MSFRLTVRTAALSLLLLTVALPALAGQPARRAARPEISAEKDAKIREMLAQTENESGLSQQKIDAYIGFINDVAAAKGNRGKINQAIQKTGMTEIRLLYIKMKTDIGCMTAIPGFPAAVFKDAPANYHPTGEETELIKKNLTRLRDASFTAEFPLPE